MKKQIPTLRFPGFTGAWEKKKLGEVTDLKNGYAFQSTHYERIGLYRIITIGNVQDGYMDTKKTNRIATLPTDIQEHQKLKRNDMLISMTGNVGRVCLVELENALLNQRVGKFIPKNINVRLLFYFCNHRSFLHSMEQKAVGGAQGNIRKEDILNHMIEIPKHPEEQVKIASFLGVIDEKIRLLEEKQKALAIYKKGIMQQLFSQKMRFKNQYGKSYPAWEKKQVNNFFKITRGVVLSMKKIKEKPINDYIYPVFSSQTQNQGLAGFYNQFLFENAITWTTDGAYAGNVKYRNGKFYCTNVCGVLISEKGYANIFVAELLNSVSRKYVSYVGNPKLMNNVMSKIVLMLPRSIQEQIKIASFLGVIDEKIKLVHQQLHHTQTYKQGLLQQLFC